MKCHRCGKKIRKNYVKVDDKIFGSCCYGLIYERHLRRLSLNKGNVKLCSKCQGDIIPEQTNCITEDCCFCCVMSTLKYKNIRQCPFLVRAMLRFKENEFM